MNTTILISDPTKTHVQRALSLSSTHIRNKPRKLRKDLSKPRSQAQFGTKAYTDGLQRAFNRAKQQIFFNPDMKYFVTLTYADNMTDLNTALHDMKMFFKKARRNTTQQIKYIYIFEYQKRGAIHVHMISNYSFRTEINDNGYKSITDWTHGFTSLKEIKVLEIKDFDQNFKPYLYLFKYMKKTQRIGKSFVHTSKNLNSFKPLDSYEFDKNLNRLLYQEKFDVKLPDSTLKYVRNYYDYIPFVNPDPIFTREIDETRNFRTVWNRELLMKTKKDV